ncbi:MAG: helix-turn-helix domain-containing protein [Clostridia bacterium]|nr:helix-turn-helix domain-containing protein [Clostridia bacterium]
MDAKVIGEIIAGLRKKNGLTQAELAAKLNISDKAVSRWENGLGFPEVTMFPALASVFGVTVDYLMTGQRKGITLVGNILADVVKQVDCYPQVGMLSNILDVSHAVGGSVPNTAISIARFDRSVPLAAIGKVGDDDYGRYVVSQLSLYGIDCEGVSVSSDRPTSFSDVITLPSGERTFFHARGANAIFSPADVDIASLGCSMLHIGYILLLDMFDQTDEEYGTVMARFLHDVQERGIKTSIDVVSDSSADYKAKIVPALKYCDYAIMNEIESTMLTDLPAYTADGKPHTENIRRTMEYMASCGVKEKVIVHCKQAGYCLDVPGGEFTVVPSLKINPADIKGSVGAGDTFCAGCLYGLYNHFDDKRLLEFASAAAASNLFAENSIDGVRTKQELETMMETYDRVEL